MTAGLDAARCSRNATRLTTLAPFRPQIALQFGSGSRLPGAADEGDSVVERDDAGRRCDRGRGRGACPDLPDTETGWDDDFEGVKQVLSVQLQALSIPGRIAPRLRNAHSAGLVQAPFHR